MKSFKIGSVYSLNGLNAVGCEAIEQARMDFVDAIGKQIEKGNVERNKFLLANVNEIQLKGFIKTNDREFWNHFLDETTADIYLDTTEKKAKEKLLKMAMKRNKK